MSRLSKQTYPFGGLLTILLFLAVMPFCLGLLPTVRFTRERIEIKVFPKHIIVTGIYEYKNPYPFPVFQGFAIPFHIDQTHPPPVHVTVKTEAFDKKSVDVHYLWGKHRFDLMFFPLERKTVRLTYRQAAPHQSARYLLRTTKPWKRPLKEGVYRLFPQDVQIVSSNYPLTSTTDEGLGFERNQFMPELDWQWDWARTISQSKSR